MAKIDTGDTVWVESLSEFWLVAYAVDGRVSCCGWPETVIPEMHCTLARSATPEAKLKLLHDLAHLKDTRGEYARRRLGAEPTD